ncbi:hypothetical protein NW069_02945 [Mycoplasmopsis cynos]|nr:hypothetical protein [Mycoplasmopsis cynos]UWV80296.1 hypothetical protein NW069_02945 [Mycoplasmopsis cynos]
MQENNLLNSSITVFQKIKNLKNIELEKLLKKLKGFADQIFEPIKITFF